MRAASSSVGDRGGLLLSGLLGALAVPSIFPDRPLRPQFSFLYRDRRVGRVVASGVSMPVLRSGCDRMSYVGYHVESSAGRSLTVTVLFTRFPNSTGLGTRAVPHHVLGFSLPETLLLSPVDGPCRRLLLTLLFFTSLPDFA